MRCAKHSILDCRECFDHTEDRSQPLYHHRSEDYTPFVDITVRVAVNMQEVNKLNRRASMVGRAQRSPKEMLENEIADTLQHNWIVSKVKIEFQE